ncbi:hypothetical protein [Nocardia sp. NPDC020380]|uniref:hypothetical protein n=1 Tax=Nocardia sp. NPDC020380 TaxID=3364309 RepID=UPI00378D221A
MTNPKVISEINGRRFHNWCACDIVMFPMILRATSKVPAHRGEIRHVYCDRVNVYADRAGAEAAAAADPQPAAAPIAELWNDTKKLADMF